MADTLLRSPSSRHAGAFRARKTSNEPSQKADSYHCHQISKLVTGALGLTARSNPNWRTRPNSDESQSTSDGHHRKGRARRNKTRASSSNLEPKSRHASQNHFVLHQNIDMRSRPLSAFRGIECPQFSEDEAYFHVYKHIDLGPFGFGGGPLTLLDLGHKCDGNPQSLVKVRPFPTKPESRPKASTNTQKEQLKAALQAGATTPRKHQSANEGQSSPNLLPIPAPAPAPDNQKSATNTTTDLDTAFQKMLQKLTRSVEQDRKDDASLKTENNQVSKPSYTMPNIGRRMNTVSDPCDGIMQSQTRTHKKEDTQDSGVCVEENCKSVLNPRAREFLTKQELMSIKNKESASTIAHANDLYRSIPATHRPKVCKHGKTLAAPASHMEGKANATQAAPPCQPVPKTTAIRQNSPVTSSAHPAVMTYGFAPFLFNNLLSSGSLLPLHADQTRGQGLGPASAALTALPALATQPVLQPLAGTFSGFPQTPILNPVFPTMPRGHADPCLVAPTCPLPVMGPMAARPSPVPKPRRPDPRDQQAYEAWIEWRKANEPGYAMECKIRQQRRAQRNMASLSKTKADDRKTETSQSA